MGFEGQMSEFAHAAGHSPAHGGRQAQGVLGRGASAGDDTMSVVRLTAAILLAMVTPALASEPQLGRLAVDQQFCRGAGDTRRSAPLIVSATTLTWASEFCMVGKMYKADRALYIEGRCSNGGAMMRHPITLAMKGERMAVTWNGEHTEVRRCP